MAIMIPNDIYYGRRKELQEKSVRKSVSITGTLFSFVHVCTLRDGRQRHKKREWKSCQRFPSLSSMIT
jgi:hypothetical protein